MENKSIIIIVIICILFLFIANTLSQPSASEEWYQEHKEAIDTYNYNHKDDYNGYNGTRRNSWAEDIELRGDGFDPDEYRNNHGY